MTDLGAIGRVSLVFLCFALIHSACAVSLVKEAFTRAFGPKTGRGIYRIGYTAGSAVTLVVAVYFLSLIPDRLIWDAPIFIKVPMRLVQAFAIGFGIYAFRNFSLAEFMGFAQAESYVKGKDPGGDAEGMAEREVQKSGAYSIVRHPLYLAGIIIFTFSPDITRNHLTISALADIYFVFGAFIEERRLLARYGEEYGQYQKEVPMIAPWPRRRGFR